LQSTTKTTTTTIMSGRKSTRGGGGGGKGDDDTSTNNAPARQPRTQAEKRAAAFQWGEEQKAAAAASGSAPAAATARTIRTTTKATTAKKATAATTPTRRKRSQPDEAESPAVAAAATASAASSANDDDSPVAPRSAKKRRLNNDTIGAVVNPTRTKAEKLAAIQAEAALTKNKKATAAASTTTAAAKQPSSRSERKQPPPTPPPAAAPAVVVAAAAPSPARRPTRSVAAAAAASPPPPVATLGRTTAAALPAAPAAAAPPSLAIPAAVAAAATTTTSTAVKSPPRPPPNIREKKQLPLPFGSPVGQYRAGAAAAAAPAVRRGEEDNTIPVPHRGDPSTLQQQQGVVDIANALRAPGSAGGTATAAAAVVPGLTTIRERQEQQEEARVDNSDDDDDEAFSSDDSYYDSTDDDDEDLLHDEVEDEEALVAPAAVAEQPVVPIPPPPATPVVVVVKKSWLRFVEVAVVGVFIAVLMAGSRGGGGGGVLFATQQWFRDTVLSATKTKNLPPCFADSPSYLYEEDVGQMILVNGPGTSPTPYCPHELPCPTGAHCADGVIDACEEFFQVSADGTACRLSEASNQTLNAIVALLQKKSAAEICRNFNPGQSGEMDWSKQYEHNKGIGIFGIPSRRPLFLFHRLVEELAEQGMASGGFKLKLVNVAIATRVEANEAPLFVVQEVDGDDHHGAQVVIGLHAEQPVPRSNVCRAKHATAWIFILVIAICMQLTNFVSVCVKSYYDALCEEPIFIGGATIIIIPMLIYVRHVRNKHVAQKQRALDIVSIREEVVARLQRHAEQQSAAASSGTSAAADSSLDSQELCGDIVWSRYSMSRALRTRMERELWPHVVADIATDQRILKKQGVKDGQRRLYWSWRSNSVGNFGTAPVVSPNQEQHHVRFQQQRQQR
jgi:hypothetical protein